MANTAKSDAYKHKSAIRSTQLTKAQTEKLRDWQMMQEMGKALGLEVPKPITNNPLDKHTNTRIDLTPGLTVILSVRRSLYDTPFQFVHKSSSFIRFLAVMEAEKAARAQKLEIRFTISATTEDGNEAVPVTARPRPDIQQPTPQITAQPYHLALVEKALAQARARL